jgi:hypothetical protein
LQLELIDRLLKIHQRAQLIRGQDVYAMESTISGIGRACNRWYVPWHRNVSDARHPANPTSSQVHNRAANDRPKVDRTATTGDFPMVEWCGQRLIFPSRFSSKGHVAKMQGPLKICKC